MGMIISQTPAIVMRYQYNNSYEALRQPCLQLVFDKCSPFIFLTEKAVINRQGVGVRNCLRNHNSGKS